VAGATEPIKTAFAERKEYWVPSDRPTDQKTPNGFEASHGVEGWTRFRPTRVEASGHSGRLATDSWPVLYLQPPMIPGLNLRGIGIMAAIGLAFLLPFLWSRTDTPSMPTETRASNLGRLGQMFFLGAGFMLIETKAVVHMALLFGGTWIVNSVVF